MLYNFPQPPAATRAAVNGAVNPPMGVRNESSPFSTAELLRLGIRNESRIDLRFANPGELINTERGDVVSYLTSTGETVIKLDVGNGSQNLQVIGRPGGVSAAAVADATTQARMETDIVLAGAVVEAVATITTPRPVDAGVTVEQVELVATQEELAAYSAALGGGGYGLPYGALGAAGAAVYGDLTEATPVYEAPPPAYEPVYYEPVYYEPAPVYYAPVYYEPEPVYYAPQNYITPPATGDGGLVDPGYYTPVNDGTFY